MTDAERRSVCRLIDLALDRCEQGNLRDRLELPRWVADLLVNLEAAAGEALRIPKDTVEAHGQLLDLREVYMQAQPKWGSSESRCASCGQLLSPLCRQSTCTRCRKMQRLVARSAERERWTR
jgi:hypothetical protein